MLFPMSGTFNKSQLSEFFDVSPGCKRTIKIQFVLASVAVMSMLHIKEPDCNYITTNGRWPAISQFGMKNWY